MKRKEFFRALLLGGSSLVIAGHQTTKSSIKTRKIRLTSPYIAGFQFYEGEEKEERLNEDDSLTLRRQPDNKHDRYAIEVYHGKTKLGYLPRDENRVVARMMDQNIEVKGQIAKIRHHSPSWRRVKVKVYYEV